MLAIIVSKCQKYGGWGFLLQIFVWRNKQHRSSYIVLHYPKINSKLERVLSQWLTDFAGYSQQFDTPYAITVWSVCFKVYFKLWYSKLYLILKKSRILYHFFYLGSCFTLPNRQLRSEISPWVEQNFSCLIVINWYYFLSRALSLLLNSTYHYFLATFRSESL